MIDARAESALSAREISSPSKHRMTRPSEEIEEPSTAQEDQAIRAPDQPVKPRILGARAFILALLLIPGNCYWVVMMEKVLKGPYPTSISIFANVIFIFLFIWIANHIVGRLFPRAALNQAELLLVYTMLAIASAMAGHDSVPVLIMMLGHPCQFATPENGWMAKFGQYLPKNIMVTDPEVLKGYYSGASTLYTKEHLLAWLVPVLVWSLFVIAMLVVFMCVNVLVRTQWMDREKLSFPIVYLPLEMSDTEGKLYKSRLMWAGFALAGGIDLINGFHWLYPNIPEIVVRHVDLHPFLTAKPWSAMGWTPYMLDPFTIGLGFLLPVDLLFSCWFFYIFWKAQLVISSAMAWDALPEFPFVREQCIGGYMAIVAFLLYSGRHTLKQIYLRAMRKPSELDDSTEAMSYRTAALGALLGSVFLIGFFVWIGLSPWIAVAGMLIYFALAIAVTRIRAELGPPVHDQHFSGPDHILSRIMGTETMGARSLTGLTFFYWFNRAYRSHPQPVMMEGLKMAQVTKVSNRRFMWGMMIAGIVGTYAAFWAFLHLAYVYGTAAKFYSGIWFAQEAFGRLDWWISAPSKPNWPAIWAMIIGFVFCTGLNILRIRSVWFPFHPIGYAISGSWSMNLCWSPLLIAWILKLTALRFGGLRLYRRAIPFFLGLILGRCIVGSAWSIIGILTHTPMYSYWGA